jgi:hypothetical protein
VSSGRLKSKSISAALGHCRSLLHSHVSKLLEIQLFSGSYFHTDQLLACIAAWFNIAPALRIHPVPCIPPESTVRIKRSGQHTLASAQDTEAFSVNGSLFSRKKDTTGIPSLDKRMSGWDIRDIGKAST